MGTNYYWRHNICSCCNRYDELHICKNLTMFRGHFDDGEWDDETKTWPTIPVITSWQDWVVKLTGGGEVWDEYGKRIDNVEFINRVEATDLDQRRRQYDWARSHRDGLAVGNLDQIGERGEWLDADGFSFYGGEFS